MYYYGQNFGGYPGGYTYPTTGNGSWGGVFAIILVLFILLVIIGCGCGNKTTGGCGCQGGY